MKWQSSTSVWCEDLEDEMIHYDCFVINRSLPETEIRFSIIFTVLIQDKDKFDEHFSGKKFFSFQEVCVPEYD